ncbi:DNA repair exonuclease SbcCD ATPase subunit [Noviherbaspirillum humi]|uniref:DNA repair exonuclease SbcCD ATPase subunit n=1 Tax=Noviherbaspirillum humi TaxID=1688639 RepID=A0A239KZ38_9BURK|nr:AAA family ATPase [Noviherbaspirillum humi]SNT22873.1 DNA repair exonuclease SbcCD ATPase subunit [Noviherbaspirillum humi]
MKLKRLLIEDFKQFTGQVRIDDLDPGLNIFTGPNEAGKTSIATAVRTLFLEKHRSSTLRHLVPWQASSGQPRIEAEFAVGSCHYLLRKSFVVRSRCELIHDGQHRMEGEEAEEALAELLRFSRPVRGSAAPEHGGVPGLLWVTQGQAQDVENPVGHAATYLRDALNQLSGSRVEAGEDVLIAAVRRELHELVTEKTRKPTQHYAAVEADLERALRDQQQLQLQQAQFEAEIDRLSKLEADYDDLSRRKPWEALEQKAEQAKVSVAALRDARVRLEQLQLLRAGAHDRIRLLQERERQRLEALSALAALEAGQSRTAIEAAEAAEALAQLGGAMGQAEHAIQVSRDALQQALAAEQAQEWREQAGLRQKEVERLQQQLAQSRDIGERLQAFTLAAHADAVDVDALHRLRQLEAELAALRARLETGATRIEYRLQPGRALRMDDQTLDGTGQALITGRTLLHLPDLGEISIVPAASDGAVLAAQADDLVIERAGLLQALGAQNLADAENRFQRWQDARREMESLERLLQAHAPQGCDALARAVENEQLMLAQLAQRLAQLPDVGTAPSRHDAEAAVAEATARLQQCQRRQQELHTARAAAEARLRMQQEQSAAMRARMEADGDADARQAQQLELASAVAAEQAHARDIEQARAELDRLAAETGEQDVDRYQRSAALQREAHTRQKVALAELRGKLEQLGASGLGERLADVNAEVEQLQRRRAELKLRADALAMLHDMLVEERDRTVQRLQAPLAERMAHYCRRLFPQSDLNLQDNLAPALLNRDGWGAELNYLSFGTREQLGILTRLAYADLLKEAGVPTLLMLDDAVVHTDAARRERIKRALLDAMQRHQILLFTCHPEAWDDLGVVPRSIGSMRVVA